MDYIRDLVGIDHIGCGFDFEDYVDQAALSKNGIDNEDPAGTKEIESAAQAHNFLDVLESRGYTQEELEQYIGFAPSFCWKLPGIPLIRWRRD